ncbi:MAG: transposase [Bacteroidota bacterium]
MKRRDAFDLYTDYLLAGFGQATATGVSAMLDYRIPHDYFSDMLAQEGLDQQTFWKEVKPLVRKIEGEAAWISIDDVIVSKPHSQENDLIAYHFDHTVGKAVKGLNILNFLLSAPHEDQIVNCPLSFEIISKPEVYLDPKTGKQKRRSLKTKNELLRERLHQITFLNQVSYSYLLFDIWFGAKDNLSYIHQKLKKFFICPLKSNRLVALSYADKLAGKFISLSKVELESGLCREVWVKGLDFPVQLVRQVFTNKDRSTAELWLITNDLEIDYPGITTTYQKRWKVEEMHKSTKQNTLLGNSPTKMEVTQANHVFASMIAYVKLEKLKIKERTNHFALKARLRIRMIQAAWMELKSLQEKPIIG